MKQHVILIVDDDTDDREIIRDAFESTPYKGHEYDFIENGDELIQHLNNCSPDLLPSLIMLDLNMPGKDGRLVLKEIKLTEAFKLIPTIVFTTSSSKRDMDTSYLLGANCFITKPDTFNKLVELATCISRLWLPLA